MLLGDLAVRLLQGREVTVSRAEDPGKGRFRAVHSSVPTSPLLSPRFSRWMDALWPCPSCRSGCCTWNSEDTP